MWDRKKEETGESYVISAILLQPLLSKLENRLRYLAPSQEIIVLNWLQMHKEQQARMLRYKNHNLKLTMVKKKY
ncbi:hypothetical protein Hdeb2414_s0688g00935901 [Helianthus debilis subsp. tardiflorus]